MDYTPDDFYIHTNYLGGIDIPFAENRTTGLCRVIEDDAQSTLYGFDDGFIPDLWTGAIDAFVRVNKVDPQTIINESERYQGFSTGVLSLYRAGRGVPGWENFRNVPRGASVLIPEPATILIVTAAGLPILLKRRRNA